jgi:hypothetical protein
MTHFEASTRYLGKIDNLIAVLLPSIQPGHHHVRLVSWDGEAPRTEYIPYPIFSDYVPAFLRHKGFDVEQAQWRVYKHEVA